MRAATVPYAFAGTWFPTRSRSMTEQTQGVLAGQRALVTGGSSGLGAAIARSLGAAGAAVVVNYSREEAGANRVVSEIEAGGGRAFAIRADVSREADVV